MIWILIPIIGTTLCWLFSLRRTPYVYAWAALSTVAVVVGVIEVLAAVEHRITLTGFVAVSCLGTLAPSVIAVFCTEMCALVENGKIREWRNKHHRAIRHTSQWRVVTKLDNFNPPGLVLVGIEAGAETRWLGNADPMKDLEAFIELRTHAQDTVDTMNRLKIGRS